MKKTASPRKEDASALSASDKTLSEAPKKKIMKPASATGVSAKSGVKPAKTSSAPSRQSSVLAAKSGSKPKSSAEQSTEKPPSKAAGTSKTSTAAAAASKQPEAKGKEAVSAKQPDCKPELRPNEASGDAAQLKGLAQLVPCVQPAAHSPQPARQDGGEPLLPESSPKQRLQETRVQLENRVGAGGKTKNSPHLASPVCKQTEGSRAKQPQSSAIPARISGDEVSSPNSPRDTERPVDTPCSVGSTDTPGEDSWSGIHHQVSPESETGSTHTTSSDDIKPRSEDYDAGGSQDDDCSNDRGVSKCGTMRCHDFLGRSSSDTSTPEELKMYEGGAGLRVEVRLRGREAETTSEEEGGRQRPRSWLLRDEVPVEEEHSEVEATVTVKSVHEHQLFSSEEEEDDDDEEETEDERSEVEVVPGQGSMPPTVPSPHFQGIVNLAFDDEGVEQDNDPPDFPSTSNFRRSVLLSVDECEELGSEEGGLQTPPQHPGATGTPGDVFENDASAAPFSRAPSSDQQNHLPHRVEHTKHKALEEAREEKSVFLTELRDTTEEEENHIQGDGVKSGGPPLDSDTRDTPPQERPCHLDLRHTEQYNGGMSKNPSDSKKADLHLNLNESQLTGGSPVHAAQSPAGNV